MPNVLFCLLQSRDKKLPSSSTHGSTPKPNWKPKALDEEYVQSKGAKVRAPSQGAGGGGGKGSAGIFEALQQRTAFALWQHSTDKTYR